MYEFGSERRPPQSVQGSLPHLECRSARNSPGGMVGEVSEGVDLSSMVRSVLSSRDRVT